MTARAENNQNPDRLFRCYISALELRSRTDPKQTLALPYIIG